MKNNRKRTKIATFLLSAMILSCNALSLQQSIPVAATENVSLSENAIPFGNIDERDSGSYSPDKVIIILKHAYSQNSKRVLKKIFSDPMFKNYEIISNATTENSIDSHLYIAADLNGSGKNAVRSAIQYLKSFDEIYYAGPNTILKGECQSVTIDKWTTNKPDPGVTSTQVKDENGKPHTSLVPYRQIDLYNAWSITPGSPAFVIGNSEVLWYNHEDLKNNLWVNPDPDRSKIEKHGWCFYGDTGSVWAENDHGTFTAGIMCAEGNNGIGTAGVAYGTKLMATMGSGGQTETDAIEFIHMIDFLNANEIKIYNISQGLWCYEGAVKTKIKEYNGLIFASAGNNQDDLDKTSYYPACYAKELDNVIAVAAVDKNNNNRYNYGKSTVEIAAPDEVVSTGIKGPSGNRKSNYGQGTGTSNASPVAAGVAALIWSADPTLTAKQVKNTLLNNADRIDALVNYVEGGRRVNAYKAVQAASTDSGDYFIRNKASGGYLDLSSNNSTLVTREFTAFMDKTPGKQRFHFEEGTLKSVQKATNSYIKNNGDKTNISFTSSASQADISIARIPTGDTVDPSKNEFNIIKSVRVTTCDDNDKVTGQIIDLYALSADNTNSKNSSVSWKKLEKDEKTGKYKDLTSKNNVWTLQSACIEPGTYKIKNANSNKMLTLDKTKHNLVQKSASSSLSDYQKWDVYLTDNGLYAMKPNKKDYANYRVTKDGSNYAVVGSSFMYLAPYMDTNGRIQLNSPPTKWCLKVPNNNKKDDCWVVWAAASSQDGDKWIFEKVK